MRPHLTLEERFWVKVDKSAGPDACWPWTGGIGSAGYGIFEYSSHHATSASRVAFFLTYGAWPEPMVLHSCDYRPCCNPTHLRAGTAVENERDKWERGRANNVPPPHHSGLAHWNRQKVNCPSGHPYDETNTGIYNKHGRPYRYCKTCEASKVEQRREARVAARRAQTTPEEVTMKIDLTRGGR